MSRPFSQVIVLAEDKCHQNFVTRYLRRRRYTGQIRFENPPSGKGCGEQWVWENYARSVAACRVRAKKARTALIVVIDADAGEIDRRARQLREAIGMNRRTDEEAIVHFIPRRNIETWILHLTGKDVEEETDYKGRSVEALISTAAETFHEWTAQTPSHCLPSVAAAIQETKRLQ